MISDKYDQCVLMVSVLVQHVHQHSHAVVKALDGVVVTGRAHPLGGRVDLLKRKYRFLAGR